MGGTDFALGNEWATLRNGLKSTGRSNVSQKATLSGARLVTELPAMRGLGVEKHDGLVNETRHRERRKVSGFLVVSYLCGAGLTLRTILGWRAS
jgi:hypothetical protein